MLVRNVFLLFSIRIQKGILALTLSRWKFLHYRDLHHERDKWTKEATELRTILPHPFNFSAEDFIYHLAADRYYFKTAIIGLNQLIECFRYFYWQLWTNLADLSRVLILDFWNAAKHFHRSKCWEVFHEEVHLKNFERNHKKYTSLPLIKLHC